MRMDNNVSIVRNGNHFIGDRHGARWILIDGPWFTYLEHVANGRPVISLPSYDPDVSLGVLRSPYHKAPLPVIWHREYWTWPTPWTARIIQRARTFTSFVHRSHYRRPRPGWVFEGGRLPCWINHEHWIDDYARTPIELLNTSCPAIV